MDINNKLKKIIDFENYPIHQASFISKCRDKINNEGCVVLPDFLNHETINQLISESKKNQEKAYYCRQEHSVFIMPYEVRMKRKKIRSIQHSYAQLTSLN